MATVSDVTVVDYSGDFRVDSLLHQSADWNYLLPSRTVLYYTFNITAAEATPVSGSLYGNFSGSATTFNVDQKNVARELLDYVASVTGIAFMEVATSASADIHFANCDLDGSLNAGLCQTTEGWSYNPVSNLLTSYTAEAYVYLDNVEFFGINLAPTAGDAGYEVLLHELGHAVGLGHPFEGLYPLSSTNDNTNNTVMSYTEAGAHKSTFQSYDLLALRWIYGEDGLGSVFGFNSTNGPSLTLVAAADTTPPNVSSFSPADEATNVAIGSNFNISFNEAIQRGVGNIVLKTSAGTIVAIYDAATSSNLSISGSTLTINPTFDLANSTGYIVEFSAGTIDDLAGNSYAGTSTYNFTTVAAPTPNVTLSPSFPSVTEGNSGTKLMTMTATLSAAASGTVSVGYATTNGEALAGSDYTATSGTLSFAAGETSKTFTVPILGDTAFEGDESFFINLTSATGAVLGTNGIASAIATITNDDSTGPVTSTITGSVDNDSLTSGTSNDTIDGAGGTDTAIYSGAISDYFISYNRALGSATITDHRTNADGTDTLKSIEKLQFSDKTFDLINLPPTGTPGYGKIESFLFDAVYYLLKNPELVPTVTLATAYNNYKSVGAASGDAPNAWFDPVYYANKWADLKPLNLDAATLFQHYNLFGVWEGRSAGPMFDHYDGNRYLADYPDVAAYVDAYVADFLGSRTNGAIAHYVIYGANEGRVAFDTDGHQLEQAILIGTPSG